MYIRSLRGGGGCTQAKRKELVEKVKSEKALIKKGYSRVMKKIKDIAAKNQPSTGLARLM